ncbi:glycosyltransferase family 4 protein [Butyrivibrio sp. XPD2006]|uniref:glycosyltransferase family 4 protein n=1 Tax=Butyrivibrio sp. XPD2006 TaxID=1280668 RepID=UPI0003F87005|nr:glycosyltransferase family 4 protein [Butyrivibrio sp. XPD2006]
MTKSYYIGSFPPPYGGVSIKNALLYEAISKSVSLEKIVSEKRMILYVKTLGKLFRRDSKYVIGVSSRSGKSGLISTLLYRFNRNSMNQSIYFMMGGTEADEISFSKKKLKVYENYKRVYVETDSMKRKLVNAGMTNVEVYPNCRKKASFINDIKKSDDRLKCVFLSSIQKEKGIEIVIDTAKELSEVEFYIYGNVKDDYRDEFFECIKGSANTHYMGAFSWDSDMLYTLLSRYDIFLFPTLWSTEGVPGVLVEAKISGLVPIVSDMSYNSEIIEDGVDGIVLESNDCGGMKKAIEHLVVDRDKLQRMKLSSRDSADAYYIENHIDRIIEVLR